MLEVRVDSIGALAVVDGVRGRVHTVLPSAAYLSTGTGPMLVLHDRAHGHTPTSLLVSGAHPLAWGVRPGDVVAGRLGRLRVGPILLDARHPDRWSPPVTSNQVRAAHAAAAVTSPVEFPMSAPATDTSPASAAATAAAAALAVRALLRCRASDALGRLDRPCRSLVSALVDGSSAATAAALAALVGAGPGFTPSGDDALVGLLAVLHRRGPLAVAARSIELLRATLPAMLERTTEVSAHYLWLALDGWFGEHLTVFVDGLAAVDGFGGLDGHDDLGWLGGSAALGGSDGLAGALPDVAAVLATGATSGADALVGVATGLEMLADRHLLKFVA